MDGRRRPASVGDPLIWWWTGGFWRILLEDLQRAYQQSLRGEAPRLPGKTSPFKAWAGRVSEHARGESMKAQLQFWRELLEGAPAELPCEHPQALWKQRFATSVQSASTAA